MAPRTLNFSSWRTRTTACSSVRSSHPPSAPTLRPSGNSNPSRSRLRSWRPGSAPLLQRRRPARRRASHFRTRTVVGFGSPRSPFSHSKAGRAGPGVRRRPRRLRMPVWPDGAAVTRALARLWRGRVALAAVNGGAFGCAIGGGIALALWIGGHPPAILLVALTVGGSIAAALALATSRRASLPLDVERRAPVCQNLVITAVELLGDPARVPADLGTLVCRHAAIRLDTLETRAVFPLGRAALRGLVAVVGCVAIVGATRARPLTFVTGHGRAANDIGAEIRHITITVHAPDYAGLPDRALRDPSDVEALAGSRLRVLVDSGATAVTLETIDGPHALP